MSADMWGTDNPLRVGDEDYHPLPDKPEADPDAAYEAAREAGIFDQPRTPLDFIFGFAQALTAKAHEYEVGTIGHEAFSLAAAEAQEAVTTLDRLWNQYGREMPLLVNEPDKGDKE